MGYRIPLGGSPPIPGARARVKDASISLACLLNFNSRAAPHALFPEPSLHTINVPTSHWYIHILVHFRAQGALFSRPQFLKIPKPPRL